MANRLAHNRKIYRIARRHRRKNAFNRDKGISVIHNITAHIFTNDDNAVAGFHHDINFPFLRCLWPLFPSLECLAACSNWPKSFDLAIADTNIPIMDIAGRVTMTWHQL